MAFTASDICKVRSSTYEHSQFLHNALIATHTDHVRPVSNLVGIINESHHFQVSPLFSLLSALLSREGVVLTCVSTSYLCVVLLTIALTTRLMFLSQTILGYMYVCTLVPSSSQAQSNPLDQPRNYSRYMICTRLSDCPRP